MLDFRFGLVPRIGQAAHRLIAILLVLALLVLAGSVQARAAPVLDVTMGHEGNGGSGWLMLYTITPSASGDATSGTLQAQIILPAGVTATFLGGNGWTCDLPTLTCTSPASIAAGTSGNTIALETSMLATTATTVTPSVILSGGGAVAAASASDPTEIVQTTLNAVPALIVGEPVHLTPMTTSGGTPPYTYGIFGLPPSLALETSTGEITGTPDTAGSYNIILHVWDTTVSGTLASEAFQLFILDHPEITDLSVQQGPAAGGTVVTITGANLSPNDADNIVSFGGVTTSIISRTHNTLTVAAPAHAAGTVDVTLTVSGTSSATSAASQFTYVDAPVLGVTMTHTGSGGLTFTDYLVTVSASGGSTSGPLNLQFSLPAGITVSAFVPPGWNCSTLTLTCTSSTVIAAGTSSQAAHLRVSMSGVSGTLVTPSVTVSGGGAIAAATASDPTNVVQTTLNTIPRLTVGKPASFIPVTASGGAPPYSYEIAPALPAPLLFNTSTGEISGTPAAAAGLGQAIYVRDSTGSNILSTQNFSLAIIDRPQIDGLSSSQGPISGGGTLTISGANFSFLSPSVSFGGVPATITSFLSDTIEVTIPPHAAGTVDVTVTINGVTSDTGPATKFTYLAATVLTFATPGTASVQLGGTLINVATSSVTAPGAGAISYASANPAIAGVDNTGTITTVSPGTTTITATQAAVSGINDAATADYLLTVTPAPLTLTPGAATGTQVGVPFSQSNVVAGGQGAYLYALASGDFPDGTDIDVHSGTISGTPTAGGIFSYNVKVTDSLGATATTGTISVTIAAPTIVFNTAALPDAIQGQSYGPVALPAPSGGTFPYIFFQSGGTLPNNISIGALGALSGTPTLPGTYTFSATVNDSSTGTGPYLSAPRDFTLTVQPAVPTVADVNLSVTADSGANPVPLAITGLADSVAVISLPANGTTAISGTTISYTPNASYAGPDSFTYQAINAGAPSNIATVSILVGALATTTTLTTSSNPTNAGASLTFTATVAGSSPTGTVQFRDGPVLLGSSPLNGAGIATFSTTALAVGPHTITANYSGDGANAGSTSSPITQTVTQATPAISLLSSLNPAAFGQSITLTASISGGAAPTGTVQFLDGGSLLGAAPLSGGIATLATATLAAGSHTLTASYLGDANNALVLSIDLIQQIDPPVITLSPATLPAATAAIPYPGPSFTATGGSGTYDFAVTGTLPTGMSFGSGALSGTPSQAGSFPLTVTATDHSTPTVFSGQQAYTLLVSAPGIVLPATSLAAAALGAPYSASLTPATGGITPYAYAITAGTLPDGITLDPDTAALSGTPAEAGPFAFTVSATDATTGAAAPFSASQGYNLTVTQQAPIAQPDAYSTAQDTTLTIAAPGLLANDDNPDAIAITAILASGVSSGQLTLAPDGGFSYVPQAGFFGTDSFTYTIDYGGIATAPATVSIAVTPGLVLPATALPDAIVGTPYSQILNPASGGSGSFAYSVTGALPAWLAFDAGTLTLSGTPTAVQSISLTIRATDGVDSSWVEQTYDFDVTAPAGPGSGSALTLTASPRHALPGQAIVFTATVSDNGAVASGQVQFGVDGVDAGAPVTLDANGQAVFSIDTLALGPHQVSATYLGGAPAAQSISVSVGTPAPPSKQETQLTLSSSSATSLFGDPVTFSARVAAPSGMPTGTVIFTVDGADQPAITLSAATATLSLNSLAVGDHQISARYSGDEANQPSSADPVSHHVDAWGTLVIRQLVDGDDAVFGFSSPTPSLAMAIATSGGTGQSQPIVLLAGDYSIIADEMTGPGYALTDIACTDPQGRIDLPTRRADITIDGGDAIVCTFSAVNSRAKTVDMIEDFLAARADLIISSLPDRQRRIDRLNGASASGGDFASALMGYLPGVVDAAPLSAAASLAQLDGLAGNQQVNPFDAWFQGTFALLDQHGPKGRFAVAAIGADYVFSPDLLIGGFAQLESIDQFGGPGQGGIGGTGWLAGPYATLCLSDHLYLDLLAAAGQSSNRISPYGSYTDSFDATRWLVDASLQGQWQSGAWTFTPAARLSYFEETSQDYTDSLGVYIPSVTIGLGQLAIGPGISYRLDPINGVVIDTDLKLDLVADLFGSGAGRGLGPVRGRLEGGIGLSLPGGAAITLGLTLDGLGADSGTALSGRIGIAATMN